MILYHWQVVGPFIDTPSLLFGDYSPIIMVRVFVCVEEGQAKERHVPFCIMDIGSICYWMLLLSFQEHKTTLRDKLQEQAKWEELNLGEGSDPPHKESPVEDSSQ